MNLTDHSQKPDDIFYWFSYFNRDHENTLLLVDLISGRFDQD